MITAAHFPQWRTGLPARDDDLFDVVLLPEQGTGKG